MSDSITLELNRDCEAVQIPVGNTVVLPAGTMVDITQTLGGAYTVRALDGLFQISAKNADALGLEPSGDPTEAGAAHGPVDEKRVWDTLRTCYDPEIPVNIVDLGLIYDLEVEELPTGASKVLVKMTLTARGCGMGPVMAGRAGQTARNSRSGGRPGGARLGPSVAPVHDYAGRAPGPRTGVSHRLAG